MDEITMLRKMLSVREAVNFDVEEMIRTKGSIEPIYKSMKDIINEGNK